MNEHQFHFRMDCLYRADNEPDQLSVENYENGQWQPLRLDLATPGFLVYAYSIFTCQHLYLRANSSERGLQLASAKAEIKIHADPEWILRNVLVNFEVTLARGTAGREDIEYIIARMKQCPVSKNLPAAVHMDANVTFVNPDV